MLWQDCVPSCVYSLQLSFHMVTYNVLYDLLVLYYIICYLISHMTIIVKWVGLQFVIVVFSDILTYFKCIYP